jgi:hypothetical protein
LGDIESTLIYIYIADIKRDINIPGRWMTMVLEIKNKGLRTLDLANGNSSAVKIANVRKILPKKLFLDKKGGVNGRRFSETRATEI